MVMAMMMMMISIIIIMTMMMVIVMMLLLVIVIGDHDDDNNDRCDGDGHAPRRQQRNMHLNPRPEKSHKCLNILCGTRSVSPARLQRARE